MRPVFALIMFTNPVWAECIGLEEPFMSCSFANDKAVEVCTDGNFARYTIGRPGQDAELALRQAFGEGAVFIPWTGVGREIAEVMIVTNNDITYEVYAGFDRMTAADESVVSHFGGIYVSDQDGAELAHLICIPSSVNYGY